MEHYSRTTNDLPFAAFCHLRGLPIENAKEQRCNGGVSYSFTFGDLATQEHPDGRWGILAIEFANSEAQRFDQAVLALKQLCRRRGGR